MSKPSAPESENLLPTQPIEKPSRLVSLDVFRGLTVAGMILVNNPGGASYEILEHAVWDGWTPTDLVFPWFLFIVGVSITFALSKRRDDPAGRSSLLIKIFRRTLIIFGLGIALAAFPRYQNWPRVDWASLRIPGVLQRIALCYLAASLIFLVTKVRGQVIACACLLFGYWTLMKYVPVPRFGAGDWEPGHDLASYLDRMLLPGHIYTPDYDPEGILSTLPSIATTLLGVLAGHWLRSGREGFAVCSGLFVAGMVAVVVGSAWDASFPVNKALWTSSFVLLTAGLALCGLATCYWLVDLQGYRRWAYPFRVFGMNPIVAYTLAAVGARVLNMPLLNRAGGKGTSVHGLIYHDYLLVYLPELDASLVYGLSFVLACFLVVWVMDLVGLHIRA